VQYGPRIAAIIVYLYIGQFLSKKRTAQALAELFGIPLSSGTVAGITARAAADCGPGTGKTVVALHRAAYLLYTHRKKLAQRGILVIGPSATFLRYIDQVLPSLGENDVVLATIGSLFPGVEARGPESSQAARVKGDTKMAGVLAQGRRRSAPGTGRPYRDQDRRHRLPAHAPHVRRCPRRSRAAPRS
jgi:hypothetical protein